MDTIAERFSYYQAIMIPRSDSSSNISRGDRTSATSIFNYPDDDVVQEDSRSVGNQRPTEAKVETTSRVTNTSTKQPAKTVVRSSGRGDRKFILSGHGRINNLLRNSDNAVDSDSDSMAPLVTDMTVIFNRSIPREIETQNKLPVITKEYTEKEKEEYRKLLRTTNWRELRYRRPVWRWDELDLGSMVYFKYAWVWQAGLLTGKYETTNQIAVIHYAKGWWFFEAGRVKEEKFTVNLDNNELMQVNIPPALQRRPAEAVARARELLGEQRYSMFTRRSSHMVLECLLKKDL